jgi:hypothetical protein
MNGRQTEELEFIQITSGASSAGGHTLYGLTKDGHVFMFERGLGRWKPMPMSLPDRHLGGLAGPSQSPARTRVLA